MTSRPARLAPLLGTLALLGLVSACGAGSSGSSGSSGGSQGSADSAAGSSSASSADLGAPEAAGATTDEAAGGTRGGLAVASEKSVISTGTVSLRSSDVGQLAFDVQEAVDQYGGEIAERSSESDDAGAVVRSRLVLRVPAESFGDLMGALEGTGTLESSSSSSEDVTAQVIDNRVRVSVQKASIERITALLAEATDIDDVVAIEAQLSTRQADLNSLEQTQAYLADQTTQSTITASLERTDSPTAPVDDDEAGFLAGLSSGWHALAVAGTGLATVAGALLPWLAVAAVVGVPLTLAARRLRRRTPSVAAPAVGETA